VRPSETPETATQMLVRNLAAAQAEYAGEAGAWQRAIEETERQHALRAAHRRVDADERREERASRRRRQELGLDW
jgi:hypothetical protein